MSLQGFSDHWLETGMQLDHSQYAEEVRRPSLKSQSCTKKVWAD